MTFLTPLCTLCTGMMSHPPIPISDLAEHTELLKANDNLRLSQEYEVSEREAGLAWGPGARSP